MTRAGVTIAAAAALLGLPAAAQASRVELTGTAGPAAEVFPLYRAAKGERNDVVVSFGRHGVTITDTGVRRIRRTKDSGCKSRSARRVFCSGVFFADVRLGDRDDHIRITPSDKGRAPTTTDPLKLQEPDLSDDEGAPEATTFVYGGTGKDKITGSSFDDQIDPGPGADTVDARGGGDTLIDAFDGAEDRWHGGGGIDSLFFTGKRSVTVRLGRGVGGGDVLREFERVHGTPHDDTIIGGGFGDALYGGGGRDHIDGQGGNDFVSADAGSGDDLRGSLGDDVIAAAAGSQIDCGPDADRVLGGITDLLQASCESVVYDVDAAAPLFEVRVRAFPVARDATGATFEVPCPTAEQLANGGCSGTVAVERPPGGPTESYGSGSFALAPGATGAVRVPLSTAGQAAVAAGQPVAVHLKAQLAPAPGQSGDPNTADFGWQVTLAP
jgi:hypothetical protein